MKQPEGKAAEIYTKAFVYVAVTVNTGYSPAHKGRGAIRTQFSIVRFCIAAEPFLF